MGELSDGLQAPWLLPPFERLQRARRSGRFPAALLIHEQRGAGGQALAMMAAQLALCRASDPPCGVCRDCQWMLRGQHPDFLRVSPVEDSKQIRVEQIRDLCEQLALTSHGGHATLALVSPADSMNANAANALLKTLEEPRAGVTLILVSAAPSRLAPTIVSRCQRLRITVPSRGEAIAWLERQRGSGPWAETLEVLGDAPFEALAADPAVIARVKSETERGLSDVLGARTDIGRVAESWGRADSFELRLTCLENWITARIEGAVDSSRQARELRSGAHLSGAASDLNMAKLLRVLDGLYELRRLRLSSINRPLALEQLLWALAGAARRVDVFRGAVRGT